MTTGRRLKTSESTSNMATTEEDFPRGGIAKQPVESRIVVQRAEVDNLFQTAEQKESKKRKGGPKDGINKSKKPKKEEKEGGLTLNAAATTVEILHIKNVKEGMLILGCVKEVTDFEVTVSLPCGLQGFLSIKNICESYAKQLSKQLEADDSEEIDSLPNIFHPGMLIRCAVAKLDTSKGGMLSIQLSINPQQVNKALSATALKTGMVLSGCVDSVEDHGYIIDIGVKGTKAFLPKKAAQQHNNQEDLKVGQYVTAVVDQVKNEGRVVRFSVSPPSSQDCAEAAQGWNLTNILPGLLVKATVKKVTKHGLILSFLSSFSGQVDFLHMEPEQASSYEPGSEVRACVLYVDPSTRVVSLSLRSYLVQPGARVDPCPVDRIGEVVENCKITTSHHMSGALLELPDQTVTFIHRNHLKEPKASLNENRLQAKAEHTCRILDFSLMDQMHFATLRKSVISKPFLRYHDIKAGQVVEGTVSVLLNHGMMVHLSDHIKGLVPRTHLSDIVLKNPEKKYVEGMKIKCRVLSVDPDKKKLYLTRKKSLVDSTQRLFLSYDDALPGRVSHGYIVCVKDFGCIVRFYNNVRGLVPLRELSSEVIVSPETVFYVGQVLKAKVLQCDPEKSKMVLSFKAAMDGVSEEAAAAAAAQCDCEVGTKVEARVLKKSVNGLEVSILPDEARAVLPTMHLSDHTSNCPLLWEGLQEGDNISSLVCCSRNKQNITLTKKPTVRWALEEGMFAKDFSEISVGMQLIGWIKNIMPYGVFVEFPHGLVGLAPKSAMADRFIGNTAEVFQLGQTVFAKVTNLDEEKRRFLVTLKITEVMSPESEPQTRLISGLNERKAAAEMLAAREGGDLHQQLLALSVGEKLKLTVDQTSKDSGATFKSDDLAGVSISASRQHAMGVNLNPGQKVTAIILHADVFSSSVDVSLLPALVAKKKSLTEGSKYTAKVQHVGKDFAVISLDDTAQLTVIQTRSHLNSVFVSESDRMKPGSSLAVEVIEASSQELQGLPLVSWQRSAAPSRRSASGADPRGLCFGQTVQGTVKAVKPTAVALTLEGGAVGSVHVSEVIDTSEMCPGIFPTSSVKVGSVVSARVIGGREASSHRFLPFSHPRFTYTMPELTLIPSKLDTSTELKSVSAKEKLNSYTVGEEITCFVSKFHRDRKSLEVTTHPSVTGTVDLLAMITDPQDAGRLQKLYKLGQAVRAKVVEVSSQSQRLVLSFTDDYRLQKGGVTVGMVTNIVPQFGLQVRLPFGAMGTVGLTDLADAYKPKPLAGFSKDQLLRCFLLESENGKWQLSLRPSRLDAENAKQAKDPEVLSVDHLEAGQIIRGYVKSAGEQGVFIRLATNITGRVQLQHTSKFFVSKHKVLTEHLPFNTLLTTKIISIDRQEELVNLSLLSEDTGKPDVLPESLGLPLHFTGEEKKKHDAEKMKKKRKLPESEQKQAQPEVVKKKKKKKSKTEDNDSGVEVYFREEEEEKKGAEPKAAPQVAPSSAAPSRLQVAAGFSWDVGLSSLKPALTAQDGDSSDGEDEDIGSKSQKKTRHELEQEKKQAEKALVQREAQLMDPSLRPEDAGAFERLLLASPNSSLLWLQYMAHHLQATQIEQARSVAERALKTISFREEQEKLNVWVALLNLENMYGTEESLKKVFERALQFCEPMPVYQQLADIYAKSEKTKEAESLYKTMVKRFRQNKAVWLSYGTYLLQQGQSDAAAALLQRALKSLPSKESVDVIAKFAQLEFRYGDAERGRSMFDKVLSSYPKRTDLWSVFIDLMVKYGAQKEVRALFDRVIHLSLSVKKIKFFFKRYLEYEKKHGTPESIQEVKEKAMEFVEAKGADAAK